MPDTSSDSLPTAVTEAYDLLLWLINHVGKNSPVPSVRVGGTSRNVRVGGVVDAGLTRQNIKTLGIAYLLWFRVGTCVERFKHRSR